MTELKLVIDGKDIALNDFVSRVLHDILLAFVNNLRDIDKESISKVEIS